MDMDTGDAEGDLFFFLDEFLLPLQCADPEYFWDKFECKNPERSGQLVATQLKLQVDSRFSNYSGCNLCDGVDPFTRKPCEAGTYTCDCMDFLHPENCDHQFVGRETVTHQFVHDVTDECKESLEESCGHARYSKWCKFCLFRHKEVLKNSSCSKEAINYCPGFGFPLCTADSKDVDCWHVNIARKTRGLWYSTFRDGFCDGNKPCSWQVVQQRTVPERCLREKVVGVVEASNPSCFDGCGARNQTSPCWVRCFFTTVLGPEAHNSTIVTGMPLAELTGAWTKAFEACESTGSDAPHSLVV
ncbi:unnamed protein product [Effrenium voratum]|nr:unnamed protein product [Effrenium voratum]